MNSARISEHDGKGAGQGLVCEHMHGLVHALVTQYEGCCRKGRAANPSEFPDTHSSYRGVFPYIAQPVTVCMLGDAIVHELQLACSLESAVYEEFRRGGMKVVEHLHAFLVDHVI